MTSLAARIAAIEDEILRLQLLAIAQAVQGLTFSAASLLERAAFDPDLRAVLGPARTPKQVGRRLLRLAGRTAGGLCLVRHARDNVGCIWSVHIHADAGAGLDGAVY